MPIDQVSSAVKFGRTVLAERRLILPDAQAPQPDHNIIYRGSEGVQDGVGVLRASQSTPRSNGNGRSNGTLFGRTPVLSHVKACCIIGDFELRLTHWNDIVLPLMGRNLCLEVKA
jgi:hypothetical protein